MIVARLTAGALALAGVVLFGGSGQAQAQCLAAFGSLNDGTCLDDPSGPAPDFPSIGIGPTEGGGPGITTGPLLPGQTFTSQIPLG